MRPSEANITSLPVCTGFSLSAFLGAIRSSLKNQTPPTVNIKISATNTNTTRLADRLIHPLICRHLSVLKGDQALGVLSPTVVMADDNHKTVHLLGNLCEK